MSIREMTMGRWMVTLLLLKCMAIVAVAAETYPVYTYKEDVGLHFSWVSGCKGRSYSEVGSGDNVLLLARTVETDDNYVSASNAGWAMVSGNTYYGFYPYDGTHYGVINISLPVTYEGQRQSGNNATSHLGAYDFMAARDFVTTTLSQFDFSHLGCVIMVRYATAYTMSVSSVTITTEGESLVTKALVNAPEQTISSVAKSTTMTLETEEIAIEKGQTMTAYLMTFPSDLSNETITLRINADDGTFVERQFTGMAMQAGKLYVVNLSDNTANSKRSLQKKEIQEEGDEQREVEEEEVEEEKEKDMEAEGVAECSGKLGLVETGDGEAVSTHRCFAPDFTIATLKENELREKERLLGDVNADGKVDLTDALMLTNYYVGGKPVAIDLSVADTNEDDEITMADANEIVKKSLSMK